MLATSRQELIVALRAHADGEARPEMISDYVRDTNAAGPVWIFSGHGSQWPGMGADLIEQDAEVAAIVELIDALVLAEAGFSPRELLLAEPPVTRVDQVQPLIFTMQLALATALRARGVRPAAVVGHSMGEVAAAVVAGGLDLADGVKVICRRSRICVAQAQAGSGRDGHGRAQRGRRPQPRSTASPTSASRCSLRRGRRSSVARRARSARSSRPGTRATSRPGWWPSTSPRTAR